MPTVPDDEAARRLLEAKLAALAEFAAGAGHEINNPVATIAGHVQLLLRTETDPERREALLTIGAQAYRIRDMIGDVMLFARPPQPAPVRENLTQATRDVVQRLASEYPQSTIEISAPDDVPVWADPTQLRIVLSELVRNAIQATRTPDPICVQISPETGAVLPRSGVVLLTDTQPRETSSCKTTSDPLAIPRAPTTPTDAQPGGAEPFARLQVIDRGIGFREIDLEHLFDPFYSGRQAGRGLGFGLGKCWRIVTLHGGRISVECADGVTTMTVLWPSGV